MCSQTLHSHITAFRRFIKRKKNICQVSAPFCFPFFFQKRRKQRNIEVEQATTKRIKEELRLNDRMENCGDGSCAAGSETVALLSALNDRIRLDHHLRL
jgi:hypothetical protein